MFIIQITGVMDTDADSAQYCAGLVRDAGDKIGLKDTTARIERLARPVPITINELLDRVSSEVRLAINLYDGDGDAILSKIGDVKRQISALSRLAYSDVYRARALCDSPDGAPFLCCDNCLNNTMALDGAPMCALSHKSLRGPEL